MKKMFFLFTAIVLVIVLLIPVHHLLLVNQQTGKLLKSFPIKNGEEFTVYFIHSVERTPWYEIYYVKNDVEIYLKETIFYSFGAGLPSNTPYDFSYEDEEMKITNYNIRMKDLVYKVGAVVADHRFVIRGVEYKLDKIAEPSTSVLFQAEKLPLYKYLIREVADIV